MLEHSCCLIDAVVEDLWRDGTKPILYLMGLALDALHVATNLRVVPLSADQPLTDNTTTTP